MHFHTHTRITGQNAEPTGTFETSNESRTAVVKDAASWVGADGQRFVTDGTPWDASIFTVTAYDNRTGEERSWAAWGCEANH